ncbi:protein FAR1-RELATED SEQUENCE 5-like [Senna tora]|uniref:Protein FAR1-RELATED SEQUENCE 5-like n=1 Tax=Senna tora TaxID=362788 RepID=A0A834SZM7_9FABA|nr:protein FAR1-RELATED SEQUENCE 5-like [Senna tora]
MDFLEGMIKHRDFNLIFIPEEPHTTGIAHRIYHKVIVISQAIDDFICLISCHPGSRAESQTKVGSHLTWYSRFPLSSCSKVVTETLATLKDQHPSIDAPLGQTPFRWHSTGYHVAVLWLTELFHKAGRLDVKFSLGSLEMMFGERTRIRVRVVSSSAIPSSIFISVSDGRISSFDPMKIWLQFTSFPSFSLIFATLRWSLGCSFFFGSSVLTRIETCSMGYVSRLQFWSECCLVAASELEEIFGAHLGILHLPFTSNKFSIPPPSYFCPLRLRVVICCLSIHDFGVEFSVVLNLALFEVDSLAKRPWEGTSNIASNDNLDMDWKPKLGMEFDNVEEAWTFWKEYGAKMGFGVRKSYTNKSKKDGSIMTVRFLCCKEGLRAKDKRDHLTKNPRQETRTNCKVRMGITNVNGIFRIYDLIEDHNHILHIPKTTPMLASKRKISKVQANEIELVEDSKLQQRLSHELLNGHVGGRDNLGYTYLYQNNYLQTRRQKSLMYGEAGCLLRYFQEELLVNPSFYHAYQMDNEEQITNIFWADARMLLDYGYFGDVISFNTTFCINNAHRPLAIFSGFNHFRGVVVFGAALLYDETKTSFKWLFETFLKANLQKKPQTIFTDQDEVMAQALHEVMPEVCHGLCTWHLTQNGIKHLGNLMKHETHFLRDFMTCMHGYDEEAQFEAAWRRLLLDYNVQENAWITSIYTLKEKWAACYMKRALTLGMQSTKHSESLNADFKRCLKPNIDIIQFFKHFERVVEDKRYNELKCEFELRQKLPRLKCAFSPMLKQVVEVYTPTIFDIFQEQFDMFHACSIKHKNEIQPCFEYVINVFDQESEFRVLLHPLEKAVSCSCRRFENFGILCCHALKVLDANEIKTIPDQYILRRFTKYARIGVMEDVKEIEVVGDPKLARTMRYKQLCPKLVKLASEVADSEQEFLLVTKYVEELSKQVMELRLKTKDACNEKNGPTAPISEDSSQPTGNCSLSLWFLKDLGFN